MEYSSAAQASDAGDRTSVRTSARRLVSSLAVVTGVSTAVICAVAFTALHKRSAESSSMESLRKPSRLYDEKCDGCRAMPNSASQYDGWPDERPVKVVEDGGIANVFVIGDWGATLPDHVTFAGGCCDGGVQYSVAKGFKSRADWAHPQYVLNVGDNFYVEGLPIALNCQMPPNANQYVTQNAFTSGWQGIYGKWASIPWLSVLGNHDYGGWRMDRGWPQQIGYSFMNYNWIMPARYFSKRIAHKGFNIDYFMIDSNAFDALGWNAPPDHNICSPHNVGGQGSCQNNGGATSIPDCKHWFWREYELQKNWLEEKLNASDARWKVVVTHFPCGYDVAYWKKVKAKYGVDLLVTGHRHQQELWNPATTSTYLQSFLKQYEWDETAPTCFVSGGGGGIISQKFGYADYGADLQWYGFFHLTIHKDWMKIELVSPDGNAHGNMTIHPHGTEAEEKRVEALKPFKNKWRYTLCDRAYCGDANNPWSRVCSWGSGMMQTCAGCPECKGMCAAYCGNKENPLSKVCSWVSCKSCEACKTTTPGPTTTEAPTSTEEKTTTTTTRHTNATSKSEAMDTAANTTAKLQTKATNRSEASEEPHWPQALAVNKSEASEDDYVFRKLLKPAENIVQ